MAEGKSELAKPQTAKTSHPREHKTPAQSSATPTSGDTLQPIDRAWTVDPALIRSFLDQRPRYEQLGSEVSYILRKRLDEKKIKYAAITDRAKTLESFAEKLERKTYDDPLKDITDFAGVRVVFLYASDRAAIEEVIKTEFVEKERTDKTEEHGPDRFGYSGLHYLVFLGSKSGGARYDDLKELVCEIQVRTVLQDAWAIVNHHLMYKHEEDVPTVNQRRLNAMAGAFEVLDDQFDRVREAREKYIKELQAKAANPDRSDFLDQELNLDSFGEYLKWRFADVSPQLRVLPRTLVLQEVMAVGCSRLADLEEIVRKTEKATEAILDEMGGIYPRTSPETFVMISLAFMGDFPKHRVNKYFGSRLEPLVEKYRHLVEN